MTPCSSNIIDKTGPSVPGGLTYTSRQYHSRSGLYYYRARWYSPELGRFLTQDPIGHLGGVNLYAYVGNAPVDLVDPLGLIELILVGRNSANRPFFTDIAYKWAGGGYPEEVKIIQVRNFQDIQDALTSNTNITKLTYIGHATPGALELSDSGLSSECVKKLNTNNISPDAYIFLYGCHTAEGPKRGGPSIAEAFAEHFGSKAGHVMGWNGELSFTGSLPRGSLHDPFAGPEWFP